MATASFAAVALAALTVTQVLGLAPGVDGNRQEFVSRACAEWTLTADDVQFFFAHADAITAGEWRQAYDIMPCRWAGTIVVDGREHRFAINGGSFAVLFGTSPDDVSYYGCKDRCARLFPFHSYGDD